MLIDACGQRRPAPGVQSHRWETGSWRHRCRWPGLMDLFYFGFFLTSCGLTSVCVRACVEAMQGFGEGSAVKALGVVTLPAQYSTDSTACVCGQTQGVSHLILRPIVSCFTALNITFKPFFLFVFLIYQQY